MIERDGDAIDLVIERDASLANFYTLSPYVIRSDEHFRFLLRLVNRSDDPSEKVSRIHAGTSRDGRTFSIDAVPVIAAGAEMEDGGGCEDPTIVRTPHGEHVFYSGYSWKTSASFMLSATGPNLRGLTKRGIVFSDPQYPNPKEAAVVEVPSGYRMFFEYAREGRSQIGVADAWRIEGPWRFAPTPLRERPDRFDAFHLSPVSCVRLRDGRIVLFYNGSTEKLAWRIGWAILDADAAVVLARCDEPVIAPRRIVPGDTDIAFGASTVLVEQETVWLYFSVSDRLLMRTTLHVPGAFD